MEQFLLTNTDPPSSTSFLFLSRPFPPPSPDDSFAFLVVRERPRSGGIASKIVLQFAVNVNRNFATVEGIVFKLVVFVYCLGLNCE